MAYKNLDMSVIAFVNGFTLWHYKTNDMLETVMNDSGYFSYIYTLCAIGDIIILNCKDETVLVSIVEVSDKEIKIKRM